MGSYSHNPQYPQFIIIRRLSFDDMAENIEIIEISFWNFDVSFEIYRGEVFGLVGESGCGKTTTGRTIIKLYDATSGDVYFKGRRICAGVQSYNDAIAAAKKQAKEEINKLNEDSKANPDNKSNNDAKIKSIQEQLKETISENKRQIALANYDQKHCDKLYAKDLVEKLNKNYENKEKDNEYYHYQKLAKKSRLVTQIQMIFQDPIASLNPRMTVQEIIAEGLIIKGITDKKYIQELNKIILTSYNNFYSLQFVGSVKACAYIAHALYGNLDETDYEDLVLTCEEFTSKANAKKIAKYLTEEFYK